MSTKLLREQRAGMTAKLRVLADRIAAENRDFTAEEKGEFEREEQAYKAVTERIRMTERVDAMEAESALRSEREEDQVRRLRGNYDVDGRKAKAVVTEEHRTLALAAWIKHPRGGYLTEKEEEACRAVGVRPDAKGLTFRLLETESHNRVKASMAGRHSSAAADIARQEFKSALTNETGGGGGYITQPGELLSNLEINMLAFGGMLQAAETITTDTGEELRWPTADDTGNKGRRIAVNAASNTTPDPTFTNVVWGAHEYTSDAILVPYRLTEDTAINLPKVLGEMLGTRLGRITNTECTTGTGGSQPWGFITRANTTSAASATALAADDLIKLQHTIDPAYRGSGCGFMMHDLITQAMRLFKDGVGRYLWQDGLMTNRPDTILGWPVAINQDMDSTISSGKKTVAAGVLSSYKVRRVNELRFYRLDQLYRISGDQDAFVAFMRLDGNLLVSGTDRVKVLVH